MRVLFNHSDTNPTSLRHPADTTCGAKCADTELIDNCVEALVVDTSVDHGTKRRHKQQRCDGACDKGTLRATRSQEFSRRRPTTTGCEHKHAVSSTNDTKTLINRPNTTKKVSKQIQQRAWAVDKMHVHCQKKRARNTDESLARICAATVFTSTDSLLQENPFQNPREARLQLSHSHGTNPDSDRHL